MSEQLPVIAAKDLWRIESVPEGTDWAQFAYENGGHASRITPGMTHSTITLTATRIFNACELAYDDVDYEPYRAAYDASRDMIAATKRSKARLDVGDLLRAHGRALHALADPLEAHRNKVDTAIDLQRGRLLVAFTNAASGATPITAARVHAVTDEPSDGPYGQLQLVISGKSKQPALPMPSMCRVPGLFLSRQAPNQ